MKNLEIVLDLKWNFVVHQRGAEGTVYATTKRNSVKSFRDIGSDPCNGC